MKTMKYIIITIVMIISVGLNAQIGVGTNASESSSIIDLNSNSKGLLMPRLNLAERCLINF